MIGRRSSERIEGRFQFLIKTMTKNKNRGVSYIEIMIAIVFSALIVVAYTTVMTNSTKVMVNSMGNTNAISWLNNTVESMRALSYDDLGHSGVWPSTYTVTLLGEGNSKTLGESNLTYNRIIAVTAIYVGAQGALKRIEVFITWTEGAEQKRVRGNTMMTSR